MEREVSRTWLGLLLALGPFAAVAATRQTETPGAPPSAPQAERIELREVLGVESLGERSRSPYSTDALEATLARGAWSPPLPGDEVTSTTGTTRRWEAFRADEEGWFSGAPFRGGWAFAEVEVPTGGAWRLDASGHTFVLVDGEPRYGDVYELGLTRVPLALEEGTHELLFRCGRGRLRAALERAPAPSYLEEKDRTLPDVLTGEPGSLWLGILVSHAGPEAAPGLSVVATPAGGHPTTTALPTLGPSSLRKCGVRVQVSAELAAASADAGELGVRLELVDRAGRRLHESELTLAVRSPDGLHARTFLSEIDGSVQYFAVRPPAEPIERGRGALYLSLHGASVEARRQAACYEAKEEGWVVAPTNRRPFGFDWEDWGRRDALEVLAIAQELFGTDPARTYLTGHSMGGHGTWQLGAHFPDRFAAIAPSAGWRDFWHYGGTPPEPDGDPVRDLVDRSANASRTLLLERNYLHGGVYVLHGDADDNVPVAEARAMRTRLAAFHPNFAYYERPGAGHWWGNRCMDWPPLFDFLVRNRLPEPSSVLRVEFDTVHPAISSRCDWVAVEAQEHWLEPSHVEAELDPAERRIELETRNVARLALDLGPFATGAEDPADTAPPTLEGGAPLTLVIEGQELSLPWPAAGSPLRMARDAEGGWSAVGASPPARKGPHRAGPFKEAFGHRMAFVYGTRGTAEENAWAYAKARFDHETWRYRGNGSVDVVADVDLGTLQADRSVVLYGNADTNAAWDQVLEGPPFELVRGRLSIDDRTLEGDDLAFLALSPRAGSEEASVAVVGGTGIPGFRTTNHLSYFVSGVAYPDWTVIPAQSLESGAGGIRGAGFFDAGWSTGPGSESAWR